MSDNIKSTIFIVDDEAELLENYNYILGEEFNVRTFPGPQEFVQCFADGAPAPDLLITDLKMPAMSGLEMIREVQQKGIIFPFILLSGYLDKKNILEAVEIGAFRMLEKPVDFDILLTTIDQLLIEHEIVLIQREILHITAQLRELYTNLRMIMEMYILPEIKDRLIVENKTSGTVQKMSFDDLLKGLETRLSRLLDTQKVLEQARVNRGTKKT